MPSVFITGASSGIGFQLALDFAQRGYQVFAGARSINKMEPLKEHGVEVIPFDISSTDSIVAAKEYIEEKTDGELDILYNNAGISELGSILDISKEKLQKNFDVNVFGAIETIQVFKDLIFKSRGTVAFTGSVAEYLPVPFSFAYSSSKQAFARLARTLAIETQHFGIKIVLVITGSVESSIWDTEAQIPESTIYKEDGKPFLKGFTASRKTPTAEYTKKVITDLEMIIKKNSKENYFEIFGGNGYNMAWLVGNTLPFVWVKTLILRMVGLDEPLKHVSENLPKRI